MKSVCAFAVTVACVVAGGAAPWAEAAAAETPARFRVNSFAEVMAPTTIFYLEIPDYARARAAYRATPRWKLWWEGTGRRLIGGLAGDDNNENMSKGLRAFAESARLPKGKLAFAVEGPDPEDDMGMPVIVFLAEAGRDVGRLKTALKRMWDPGFVERAGDVVIQGTRFDTAGEFLLANEGGLMIGSLGKVAANGLLSRFAERPWQSLAGSPAYKLAKARALKGAHFMTFTNYTDIWRMLAMELDEDWLPVERTGLPQLAATSLSGRFTPEGVVDKLSFILRGRARGMWKLLRPEPLSRKAWTLLPEFTSGFVSMKLPERTQPFLDLLRAIDPEIAEEFTEGFREFREEIGINFERDILRLTTGEFTTVFLEEDRDREPDAPPDRRHAVMMGEEKFLRHVVLLVELKDPAKARATMDRLVAVGFDGERLGRKRGFGKLEGWEFGDDMDGPLYVAGSGGIGMIALSPEPIERLAAHIAKRGPRLVDSAEFREATAWIPAVTGFAAYSNVRKIMRGLHALVSSEIGKGRGAPVKMPKVEELMADLTPLTACVHIEKPGFAFEIHSPDGIWPFYFQLMAHLLWRVEEEPRQARRQARTPGLPRVGAGANPEMARAYADLRKRLARVKRSRLRMTILERSLAKFRGTPYEKPIKSAIAREKTQLMAASYGQTMAIMAKLKSPDARVKFLTGRLPVFAGTRYEALIDRMIERAKAERGEPEPVGDEDDVF